MPNVREGTRMLALIRQSRPVLLAIFAAATSMAMPSMVNAQSQPITICVTRKGKISGINVHCKFTEVGLTWNIQGPAGPAGLTGLQGAPGPAGSQGPVGPQGPVVWRVVWDWSAHKDLRDRRVHKARLAQPGRQDCRAAKGRKDLRVPRGHPGLPALPVPRATISPRLPAAVTPLT